MGLRVSAILSRLAQTAMVLVGTVAVSFFAMRAVPGDPALAIAGGADANPTPEVLARIRADYGLDQPLWGQFLTFLGRLARGDLGHSYRLKTDVFAAISEQAGATLQLALAACAVAFGLSILLALLTAGRSRAVAGISSLVELVLASTPTFWLGLILLSVFSYGLGWFPSISRNSPLALVLPALTLGLPLAGVLTQVLREALEDTLRQPFVLSARARGKGQGAILLHHAFRHALVPFLTLGGYLVGTLLAGTVITETLFNRQGIGKLLLNAVLGQDMPVVIGVTLLASLVFVLINMLVDLAYPLIDPRLVTTARRSTP
ncbi:MAG: ABC transporter permease [Paracoccaceae bacterium]